MSRYPASRKSRRLLFFVALFVGVVIYAFWPGNKKQFEEDAKIPLEKDPDQETED